MKQIFEEPEQQKPSTQVSVTPKEFAEAVAEIENRRAQKAPASESVSVGDAIQQLGLTVSADEVLAVIETRKAEETRKLQQSVSRRRQIVKVIGRTVFALSLLLNIYFLSRGSAPPPPLATAGTTFTETGTMHSISGQGGTVHFPQPYRIAPNVEIEVGMGKTRVTNITNTEFTWENTGPDDIFNSTDMTWKAEGVR